MTPQELSKSNRLLKPQSSEYFLLLNVLLVTSNVHLLYLRPSEVSSVLCPPQTNFHMFVVKHSELTGRPLGTDWEMRI